MNSVLQVVVVATLAMLFSCNRVGGCMCAPLHPQAEFCQADFVIKARVSSSRLVELKPNGKYRPVDQEKEVVPEIEDVDSKIEIDDGHSGKHELQPVGPLIPETINYHVANGPPVIYDIRQGTDSPPGFNGDSTGTRRERSATLTSSHSYVVGGPPGMQYGPIQQAHRRMVQYRISIGKVFKGLENFTKQQRKFIYTPSLCDVELFTNKTSYILMGYVHDNVLMISLCDYKLDVSKLPKQERKNVIHNMETRYRKACPLCNVKLCGYSGCKKDIIEPNVCEWENRQTLRSSEASQYACMQTKKGECRWYNPINKVAKARRI